MRADSLIMKTVMAFAMAVLFTAPAPKAAAPESVMVFAAASMTDAVTDIAAKFEAKGLGKVTVSFASSSTLARQIENGAPADVFISANAQWMDHLESKGEIAAASRFDTAGNRLVLVAPARGKTAKMELKPALFAGVSGEGGRIAVGDPSHVPSGMYAREALISLGAWEAAEKRLARTQDARAALFIVARGEAELGIVYLTDAYSSGGVAMVDVFPESSHRPIVYPAALTARGSANRTAARFLDFLRSDDAGEIFRRYGFSAAAQDGEPR